MNKTFNPGNVFVFTFPTYGNPYGYPELAEYTGKACAILHELKDEDSSEEGRMFKVLFGDGLEMTVFEDELS